MKRRRFIKIIGTAGAGFMLFGATSYHLGRKPENALRPWQDAGKATDPRLNALSYAILAPNPHNRQPWKVALDGENGMRLYCDMDRRLPETDPFDRQILIGLGCFLELLDLATRDQGRELKIELFPEGIPTTGRLDRRPIAAMRMVSTQSIKRDPLFDYCLDRRSNKNPFAPERVPTEEQLAELVAAAHPQTNAQAIGEPARVSILRDLTWEAMRTELHTDRTYMESVNLFRIGRDEINANPDGIDLGGPLMETLRLTGLMSREAARDRTSTAFLEAEKHFKELMYNTNAYLWLGTNGNSRIDQIATGRSYLRVNLKATQLGIDMHPVSQTLQEYAEVRPQYEKLHETLGVAAPARIQMLARIGFGARVDPSPRWRLQTRVINT